KAGKTARTIGKTARTIGKTARTIGETAPIIGTTAPTIGTAQTGCTTTTEIEWDTWFRARTAPASISSTTMETARAIKTTGTNKPTVTSSARPPVSHGAAMRLAPAL